ncbi:MAG: hypothetical protein U9N85_07685 [Bacteroidota bacterium]|nr:hypothetical protein [Bacteroidota bacterium]
MKRILFWALAVVITIVAAVYQKMSGPTYPKKVEVELNNKTYNFKFIRSFGGEEDAVLEFPVKDEKVTAKLFYKNYPQEEGEQWEKTNFFNTNEGIAATMPNQPPAGKLMYYVELETENGTQVFFKDNPLVIRFKGAVPLWVLIPHIFFMFFGMLIANAAGAFAVANMDIYKKLTTLALIVLGIGGMILGPIVQKFAFLEYWAGVPFGWDLTDNKLLIAFVVWVVAFLMNRKKDNRYVVIIAAIVTLIIFSIPHSMHGSELDRASGKITQGIIYLF